MSAASSMGGLVGIHCGKLGNWEIGKLGNWETGNRGTRQDEESMCGGWTEQKTTPGGGLITLDGRGKSERKAPFNYRSRARQSAAPATGCWSSWVAGPAGLLVQLGCEPQRRSEPLGVWYESGGSSGRPRAMKKRSLATRPGRSPAGSQIRLPKCHLPGVPTQRISSPSISPRRCASVQVSESGGPPKRLRLAANEPLGGRKPPTGFERSFDVHAGCFIFSVRRVGLLAAGRDCPPKVLFFSRSPLFGFPRHAS